MLLRRSTIVLGLWVLGGSACAELSTEVMEPTDSAGSAEGDGADDVPATCGNGALDPEEDCDDGNDDLLDGCLPDCRFGPVGFGFGIPFATPLRGSPANGMQSDDRCEGGQVLVGIEGHVGGMGENWLRGLRGLCGTLELTDEGGELGVRVADGDALGFYGNGSTEINGSALCPPGEVVVGFGGTAGAFVHRLSLDCAPVSLVDGGGGWAVEVGEPAPTESFGGEGGGEFEAATCGSGAVALVTNIRFLDHIDAFGVSCAELVLETGS